MSHHPQTADTSPLAAAAGSADHLRRLYSARFVFAVVWAVLLAVSASTLSPFTVVLLVLYPLVDVGAAVVDLRASGSDRPRGPLLVNVVLSLVAAVALAVAASSGVSDVLRVWGAWAITAGVVQVVVALRRRRLGGQTALVVSGAISVVAGAGFVLAAAGSGAALTGLAGYAALGGIFFLGSAIRLHRSTARARPTHG